MYFDGGAFLDLFAGSGAVGIEALSRNARSVVFVENNPNAVQAIRRI
jgi:16S rRNA G966 N2-methylase RsmD